MEDCIMKKNIYYIMMYAGMLLAFMLGACQQGEELGDIERKKQPTRGGEPLRCLITTTAEGKVDSLINDWVDKGNGVRDAISYLEVSGPVNGDDLKVLADFQYLDSLVLTQAVIESWPSDICIQSQADLLLPLSLKVIEKYACRNSEILSVIIPDHIAYIGSYAFSNCDNLKKVRLPQHLDQLPENIFYGCSKLETIEIPANVTNIGYDVFSGCTSLKQVILPKNLKEMGGRVFSGCTNLESVSWPDGLHTIPSGTFNGCKKLKFIIPDHITQIGSYAFYQCTAMTEINFPASLVSIEQHAFAQTGITSLVLKSTVPLTERWFFRGCPLRTLVIEEGVTSLPEGTFADCVHLENITLPSSLKSMDAWQFANATSLKAIQLNEGLENIGGGSFSQCTALEQITLPNSVKTLGDRAFERCTKLASATLNEGLESIGPSAFIACTSLKSVIVPASVKSLGASVFEDCRALTSVTLNEGLESIGYGAFESTALTSLTVPSTVKKAEIGLVRGCNHITHIIWNSPVEAPDLITDDERNLLVYLPHGNSHHDNLNQIVNGQAQRIRLKSSGDFYCPESFTAASIFYERDFNKSSGFGNAGGWQTLVLPFTVSSIETEDGRVLAPFGADVAGAKPFWLRELTPSGFVKATRIEANKPYIIAMPNHKDYLPEYNIKGKVVFRSENVSIPVTVAPDKVDGVSFDFYPSYLYMEKNATCLAVNRESFYDSYTRKDYPAGSVFAPSRDEIRAFEAYVKHRSASTRGLIEINSSSKTRAVREVGPVPMEDDM